MTMQMPDRFVYRGQLAEAIAVSRKLAFSPARNFGIQTFSWATSNHRGFWCNYVIEEALVIHTLHLVSKDDVYPVIEGIQAEPVPEYVGLFENHIKPHHPTAHYAGLPMQYVGLNYVVDYSGSILIGLGIKEGSRIERYHQLLELEFEDGILMRSTDVTEKWAKVHDKASAGTTEDYWWQKKENDYYDLINYGLMGIP